MVPSELQRKESEIPVLSAVTCDPQSDLLPSTLSMINLGVGGVFVQTAYPFEVGTQVEVSFNLGDAPDPIQTMTTVRWIRQGPPDMVPPPGMSLEFTSLTRAHTDRIERVINLHSANISYLKKHNALPEGAVALSPPKMTLLFNDDTALEGSLQMLREHQFVATVALPFARKGEELRTILEDGTTLERGRVSWLSFANDEDDGVPSLHMGVELSLSSWGEEQVRRSTSPIPVQGYEDDTSDQLEYEILQSIPASLTMAPTLPIKEEEPMAPPPPPEKVVVRPHEVKSYPEPVRAISMDKRGLPKLQKFEGASRRIGTEPAKRNSDTFPIAPAGGLFSRRKISYMVAGIAVVAVFSLVSMNMGNAPQRQPERTPGDSLKERYNELVYPKGQATTVSRGQGISLGAIPAGASVVVAAPDEKPAAPSLKPDAALHDAPLLKKVGAHEILTPSSKGSPAQVGAAGRTQRLKITGKNGQVALSVGTVGRAQKVSHYLLANPHGVVINLKGATFSLPKGYQKGIPKGIRKVKNVPLKNGGRLIVYTKKAPQKVRTSLRGGIVQLRFN